MLPINLVPLVPDTATCHKVDIVLIMLVVRYARYLGLVFYCRLVIMAAVQIVVSTITFY
jgi:hypothetical protein